ncbi:bacteriocin immunity protein [Pseudomonas mandelii]|uniref:Bacteriocin immunity protein n=1 Tax=Pseudomonas mandelii TaxID=75612 RepID=A0A502HZT6_9PSED|nr:MULTISPECIES: bacteriocin immunity protein [Pseudomonas]TPG79274.1 bacteriocin immunity protein [Pseudomonas mandelii]TPG94871.1 bacteriocin immunity protein [Pseudomonas caspiana]
MILKNKFEDYTEHEYLILVGSLFEGDYSSEDEHDAIVENIVLTSEHPDGTGVLYDPREGIEDNPNGVINAIKQWRLINGKPGFKTEIK